MRTQYQRGADKERRIMKRLRSEGFDIVLRSAGSHSPIDVVAIDIKNNVIKLIQSKMNITEKMREKILGEFPNINGEYMLSFEAE